MKKVAILTAEGFEESELKSPQQAVQEAGYEVEILSPVDGSIRAWKDGNWSESINVDHNVNKTKIDAKDYEALIIPGGVINPDQLRQCKNSMRLIQEFNELGKPIAAICHGPQVLIEAEIIEGKSLTSFHSVRKDLENAGAHWLDEEVVIDGNIITSRTPEDLEIFNETIIKALNK